MIFASHCGPINMHSYTVKLSERKVLWFTGFHSNVGKHLWFCFICIESAAIAQSNPA